MEECINQHHKVKMPYNLMKLFLLEECLSFDEQAPQVC